MSELLGAEGVEPEVCYKSHICHYAENLECPGFKGTSVFKSTEAGEGGEYPEERTAGDKAGSNQGATVATGVAGGLVLGTLGDEPGDGSADEERGVERPTSPARPCW